MKIIIDVPYNQYAKICAGDFDTSGYFKMNLRDAFRNGTPLPKGHGDLVDRDEVIDLLYEQEYNYYTELDKVADTVYEADAIIEADRERIEDGNK